MDWRSRHSWAINRFSTGASPQLPSTEQSTILAFLGDWVECLRELSGTFLNQGTLRTRSPIGNIDATRTRFLYGSDESWLPFGLKITSPLTLLTSRRRSVPVESVPPQPARRADLLPEQPLAARTSPRRGQTSASCLGAAVRLSPMARTSREASKRPSSFGSSLYKPPP